MRLLLIFQCSFLLSWLASAQEEPGQFYLIENLLSKELIKTVAKDEEGYVWIGTDDGVLRYDGYQTRLFYKGLSSKYIKAFLKRSTGQFYVLYDFGLREIVKTNDSIYFRPLSMGEQVYDDRLNYPKAVFEDREGNIWIGEHDAVIRYDRNSKSTFELGEEFRSIDYHRSFTFAEDAFGNVWIAPWKGPLLLYDRVQHKLRPVELNFPLTAITGIANVKGDNLVLGGKEGMIRLKIDSDHKILEQEWIDGVTDISTLRCLNDTHLYIGTWGSGLYTMDFSLKTLHYQKIDNVPINDVLELFYDETKKELWITGSENIGLLKPTMVTAFHDVGQNRIESLTVDQKNNVYYSVGQQVYYLDQVKARNTGLILSADDTYFNALCLQGDDLWIGDAFGKIVKLNLTTRQRTELLGGISGSIQHVYEDKQGDIWFAGRSNGLVKVNQADSLTIYPEYTQAVALGESSQGDLYCISSNKESLLAVYHRGEDRFSNVRFEFKFDCPDDISVNDFQFDTDDNIWFATDEGLLLARNENGKYSTIEKVSIPGLSENDAVRAVVAGEEYLCFANSQGLVIYKDGDYIIFNQDSGLPSRIIKERGLIFDKKGNLLIATAKGMAVIEHDAIQFRSTIQPVFKTLMVNDELLTAEEIQQQEFPYKTRMEAEFISLSYPAPTILYQTRILGIDDNWSVPSGSRNLNVIGFSEGNYSIEIRAREYGRLWSEPLVLNITILRPWYRTWWAIVLFVVAGVLVVVVATQIHNNNLIRQKRNLQRIIEERTEEVNRQKNEIIEQQKNLIRQKEELIAKNEAVYRSQQALNEADMNYLQLKEKQLQDEIEYKNKQITTHALNILQKNETLKELRRQLEEIVKHAGKASTVEIKRTLKTIDESFKLDKDWEDFKFYFEQIHTGFYSKLTITYPDLTPLELRHCALIRLNLTLAECASILGISHDSIKVSRTRLRKKLNLTPDQSLTEFILSF